VVPAERFGEARLQCRVKFFIHGDAHLFELGGVVLVEFGEAVLDGEAEFFLLGGGFAGEFAEAACAALHEPRSGCGLLGDEVSETLGDGIEILLGRGAKGLVRALLSARKAVRPLQQVA